MHLLEIGQAIRGYCFHVYPVELKNSQEVCFLVPIKEVLLSLIIRLHTSYAHQFRPLVFRHSWQEDQVYARKPRIQILDPFIVIRPRGPYSVLDRLVHIVHPRVRANHHKSVIRPCIVVQVHVSQALELLPNQREVVVLA